MAPLALPHCQELPYWHNQLVLSCYPHQPESHQLSQHMVLEWVTSGPIDQTPGTPGSAKNTIDIVYTWSFACLVIFLQYTGRSPLRPPFSATVELLQPSCELLGAHLASVDSWPMQRTQLGYKLPFSLNLLSVLRSLPQLNFCNHRVKFLEHTFYQLTVDPCKGQS